MRISSGASAPGPPAVLFLAILAVAVLTCGAASGRAQATSADLRKDSWPQVHLSVVVLDKSGDPKAALPASSFHVFEDRIERQVKFVSSQDTPMSVAFVIDTSGSMYKQETNIATVVRMVTQALPPRSEIAAIEYSETPHVEQPLAPVAGNGLSMLQHLDARGCTALLDGVMEADALLASEAHNARRALVLIGDGGDNCSTHSLDEAVRALQQSGAPSLYAFLLTPVKKETGPTEEGGLVIKALVRKAGMVIFAPRKNEELAERASNVAAAVRSQYVLTFTTADPAPDGKIHSIEVRISIRDLEIFGLPAYRALAE